MRNINKILIACAFVISLSGCRKDLVYEPKEEMSENSLELEIDWELEWEYGVDTDWNNSWSDLGADNDYDYFRPRKPEGIAVVFYDGDLNDYYYNRELHLPASGGTVKLDETTKAILLYNDDSEYISLNGLASPLTAYASTRTSNLARGSIEDYHPEERIMNAPDVLYGAYSSVDELNSTKADNKASLTLKPLVYGYVVKFHIEKNREFVAGAQGKLAGMAENIFIKDGRKSDSKAIIPFTGFLTSYGVAAQIITFGTPDVFSDSEDNTRHDLILDLLLTNGKTISFDYDITEQLDHQPTGGVIILEGLEIPDEMVKGSSGFETDVDSWGDDQQIDLPISKR